MTLGSIMVSPRMQLAGSQDYSMVIRTGHPFIYLTSVTFQQHSGYEYTGVGL